MNRAEAIDFLMAKSVLVAERCWTEAAAAAFVLQQEADLRQHERTFRGMPQGTEQFAQFAGSAHRMTEHELTRRLESLATKRYMTAAEHTALLERWDERLDNVAPADVEMGTLEKWDAELEDTIRHHVPKDRRAALRERLHKLYGTDRLMSQPRPNKPPPTGWLVLQPAAHPAPLKEAPEQSTPFYLEGNVTPMRFTRWEDEDHTIAELAQRFADHSENTVWLDPALATKPRRFRGGNWGAAPAYIAMALRSRLTQEQVRVEIRRDDIVVLRDDSARIAAREEKWKPKPATPEQLARARDAFSLDDCWAIIATVLPHRDNDAKLQRTLKSTAKAWSADQALGFSLRLNELLHAANTHELWGAAYLINGGCSDDGFVYFREWLIQRGRDVFEAALRDPEILVDHITDEQDHESEILLHLPAIIYHRITRQPLPYEPPPSPEAIQPRGEPWTETDLPHRYPRLHARLQGNG